jgi:hypothetical protein
VEVGVTSTFVTHDVTKVEVRWAETHLKLKSHAPKGRGRLTPRTSAGLSDAQGRGSVIFSLIFFVFSIFHMFCILVLVFHVVHMYLFETWFSWRFSLFLCSTYGFKILFKSVALSIFFSTSIFSD